MSISFQFTVDRTARAPLANQIHRALRDAIREGRLASGARLPSWCDLAAQLGVARGTVRTAYQRLVDEQLIIAHGAAGTWVAERSAVAAVGEPPVDRPLLPELFYDFENAPLPFQMGVPAQDAFPFKLWSRILVRSARTAAAAPVTYPDPRGHPALRSAIAAYLAIARGVRCAPAQILITAGFSGALGLTLHALQLEGGTAWLEEPAFPLTRTALRLAGMTVTPVPVDDEGIDVAKGIQRAPHHAVAIVTPGQQAPLGMTMSLARRLALLKWAGESDAWIIEDDYLGELQLSGRAAPALASLDQDGRVLHVGTFSKTISPALRLGFLVVPAQLVSRFGDAAACLAPGPATALQLAVAEFMSHGHYLRHLRRMKRLYAARRNALVTCLQKTGATERGIHATGGLSVSIDLPNHTNDLDIAIRALRVGLAPVALSPWYALSPSPRGLLLGITNLSEPRLASDCAKLMELVHRFG